MRNGISQSPGQCCDEEGVSGRLDASLVGTVSRKGQGPQGPYPLSLPLPPVQPEAGLLTFPLLKETVITHPPDTQHVQLGPMRLLCPLNTCCLRWTFFNLTSSLPKTCAPGSPGSLYFSSKWLLFSVLFCFVFPQSPLRKGVIKIHSR